jgi:hypothetical protein
MYDTRKLEIRGKGILIKNKSKLMVTPSSSMHVHEKEHKCQGCTAPRLEAQAPT